MTQPTPHTPDAGNPARPKRLRTKVMETGINVAGFGNVLRAWRAEGNRFKNVCKSLGKKAADMLAGSMVSMSFRLIAITWVAGIIGGVSTFGALALLATATGAASAVYTYSKHFAGDKLKMPKGQRHTIKLWDKTRAKKSALAFAGGFASGGVGLWLAKTEIVQWAFGAVQAFFKPATDVLSTPFNDSAAKMPAATPAPAAVSAAPLIPRFAAAVEAAPVTPAPLHAVPPLASTPLRTRQPVFG